MDKDTVSSGGFSFLGAMGLMFVFLKLMDFLVWSWWWITAPFWMPMAFWLLAVFVLLMIGFIGMLIEELSGNGR